MKLPAVSFTLCLLWEVTRPQVHRTSPLYERQERLFRARTDADWAVAWHQESHVRCRDSIARHLYWACEKDIYKISKRNNPVLPRKRMTWPLLKAEKALTLLRVRRAGASISDECCRKEGCTWEEYAEYCPNNRRKFTTK